MGVWDSSYNFRLLFHRAAALKGGAGPQPSGPQMARGGLTAALATDWGLLLSAQVGPGGIQCMRCPGTRALCLPPSGGLRLISPHRVGGKLGSKDKNDAAGKCQHPPRLWEAGGGCVAEGSGARVWREDIHTAQCRRIAKARATGLSFHLPGRVREPLRASVPPSVKWG